MTRESKSSRQRKQAPRRTQNLKSGADKKKRGAGKRTRAASGETAPPGRRGQGAKRTQPARRSGAGRWLRRLLVWGLVLGIWLGVAGAGVVIYYAHDLPDVDKIAAKTRQPSVTLLARDGSVLASFGQLYGESVSISELPPALPRAVLAAEDRRFYRHFGIDPFGLARAMYVNLKAGGIVQGGSTITQQLAKNLFLTPARTIKRKVQEVLLAFWLEYKFSKDEILALYLNRVYLGAGAYGVDAAAQRYFGKGASGLNLYEAAMLAGLLKAPSRYNPASNPEVARERAGIVLQDMVAAGYLTASEAENAAHQRRGGRTVSAWRGRYFADWVMGRVDDFVGYHAEDLVVETTLDRRIQRIAEQQLTAVLRAKGGPRNAGQGASVIMSPKGAVRALVGGRDYRFSQFNRATQARRQPGSAFKPFVYLTGLEDGLTPDTKVTDEPVRVKGWAPENYGDRYYGTVTLREAFARSLNSVAVKIVKRTGVDNVVRTAQRLGIDADLKHHPSLALGTSEVSLLDLTGAYAVMANGGYGVIPFGIRKVRDSTGRVLYRRQGGGMGRLIAPRHVRRLTDLLRANVAWGTGKGADPARPAAGKTGTTQRSRDAWFVGFTAELVAGVWMGNDDGAPMREVTGGTLPAEIWQRTMSRTLAGVPPKPLPGLQIRVADRDPEQDAAPRDSNNSDSNNSGETVIDRVIQSLERADPSEPASAGSSGETGHGAPTSPHEGLDRR